MSPRSDSLSRACLVVIAFVVGSVGLYLGRDLLVPIAFAAILTPVFRPFVKRLKKLHVPETAAAAVVIVGLIAALALVVLALSAPVQGFIAEAPRTFAAASSKLERLRVPFERASHAADRIGNAIGGPTSQSTSQTPSPLPGALLRLFGGTASFLSTLLGVLLTLFLMLATGDLLKRKICTIATRRGSQRDMGEVMDQTQGLVFRYITLLALINACQASLIGVAMWLLGMPSPWLWGLFTFVLEFVPYLGAAAMITLLGVVAVATLDGVGHILAVPVTYFVMSTINTSVIAPIAYGRRLRLNPLAVLIGVLYWWFVWGVPGAFMAVPLVGVIRTICDHLDSFHPTGELLSE